MSIATEIERLKKAKNDLFRAVTAKGGVLDLSQKLDEYPESKARYLKFHESMNVILEKCFLGKLYIQNPYECFVLMCILSDEPLGTYADVWELSYHS